MEAQDLSEGQEGLASEVMENVGMSEDGNSHENDNSQSNDGEGSPSRDTLAVQKRLKAQKRAHAREVAELHARMSEMEARMTQPNMPHNQTDYPYGGHENGNIDEHIHKAVSYALNHRDMEERKAREAQQQAHVHRQYQELNNHLDKMSDKYDDFDDVVRGSDTPFTSHMRDYALTLPRKGAGSAGEVLYKLGHPDNRKELERISKLHPLEQASEMAALSHALISGGERKEHQGKPPLGNIKTNPVVNSHAITEKTPIGDLRKRMRAGWK